MSLSPLATAAIGSLESALSSAAAGSAAPSFYEELRDGFAKDMVEQFNTGTVVLIKPDQVQGADPHNAFSGTSRRTPRNAIVTGFPVDKISDNILASDRRVLIDAADFTTATEPDGSDRLEIDGKLHALVSLQAVPAAGVAVIYIMQARTAGVAA
jgi:hypothetical protein